MQGAPLSGTEPLATVMGLESVTQTTNGKDGIVRFSAGTHGSILDPASSLAVTVEIQSQIAAFQITNGATISVTNTTVIANE